MLEQLNPFVILIMEAVTWLWLRLSDRRVQKQMGKIVMFPFILKRQIGQARRQTLSESNLLKFRPVLACTKSLVYKFYNGFEGYQSEDVKAQADNIKADAKRKDWYELILDMSSTIGDDHKERIHLIKRIKNAFPGRLVRVYVPKGELKHFVGKFPAEVNLLITDDVVVTQFIASQLVVHDAEVEGRQDFTIGATVNEGTNDVRGEANDTAS